MSEGSLRITIVTGPLYPVPPAPCGAVERIWHELGEEFARRGHRVTVLCRSHPSQGRDEEIGGVRYVRRTAFRRTGRLALDLAKDMAYSLRMLPLIPRSDVTVTNVFWLPAVLGAWRGRAGRVVINVARAPKGQMKMYAGVDRLAAVSTAVQEQVLEQWPGARRLVKVLPNPIATGTFTPPDGPRGTGGERVVLYTGRVHPEKGIDLLVEAFGRVHGRDAGLRLKVVGPQAVDEGGGGEGYLRGLREKARGLPVEFLPPVYGRAALADLLRSAQYYCYPSLAEKGESFGVAPLEAMATGLVPVVSDLACFRDFITEGETGFFFDHRSGDPVGALAGALGRVIGQPAEEAGRMGRAAVEAAQGYSVAAVAEQYLEDFRELVGGRRVGAR